MPRKAQFRPKQTTVRTALHREVDLGLAGIERIQVYVPTYVSYIA